MFRAFVVSALGFSVLAASCNRAPAEPVTVDLGASAAAAPTAAATSEDPAPPQDAPAVVAASPTQCPKDPAPQTFPMRMIDVSGIAFEAEIASTDQESERGLMYRMNMPENHGMLFNLHVTKDHEFWMHNTCIPLDMMFIDGSGRIVGILENVPVLNDDPRSVGRPSLWVLEVNAGWSRRHGVKAGDTIRLPKNN